MVIRMSRREDAVKSMRVFAVLGTSAAVAAFVLSSTCGLAQESVAQPASVSSDAAVHDLEGQVQELRALVEQMRSENAQSRTEMQQLRQELHDTREMLAPLVASRAAQPASAPVGPAEQASAAAENAVETVRSSQTSPRLEDRVQKLEESTALLGEKVDEQYQTKVESASKYRARLSGIVLMNAFRNVGASDNLDFPDFATPTPIGTSQATSGATLRQTEIGLEVFGPNLAGAKSSANVRLDFAGGFPATPNGVDFGIVRMQTASLRLDWERTSVIAGQDSLFISPLSPTSFASLATPALAYAGNLWAWTPQIRLEHRFDLSSGQTLTVQGGVLDNLDWEPPNDPFYRYAQAGEQSGYPAYAARTSWSKSMFDHPLSFGAAGYYGRQNWTWGRFVDAWGGMADWQIPIVRRLNLSGEFYRGRGIGGLGAGIGRSVLFGGKPSDASTPIHGLDSEGGWSQLQYQLTPKLQLNAVYGEDNPFANEVRGFAIDANNYTTILGRNRSALGNLVYRPRSDLVLSAEFRRLRSFPVYSGSSLTSQVNLSLGILF
jgi:hypothetical protein